MYAASMATTRCQYQRGLPPGGYRSPSRGISISIQGGGVSVSLSRGSQSPSKTKTPPCELNDTRSWKHYLPVNSLADGKNESYDCCESPRISDHCHLQETV